MTDQPLRPEGLRALHAERRRVRDLKHELRDTRLLLHNLRSAVVSATNHLIDVAEEAGAQRNDKQ